MSFSFAPANRGAGTAYLFPGQGAQTVGMGQQLYDISPAARSVFHQVDMALGRPLTKLLFGGREDQVCETVNAQPAIMAVSLACIKAMEDELGVDAMPRPAFMAGHSLGEYTAKDGSRKRRASLKSNIMFLERYSDLLKPGGRLCTIIDESVLNTDTDREARLFLLKNFLVRAIISLPQWAFFEAGSNVKTSILF